MKGLIICGSILIIFFSPGFQCGRNNIYSNCPNGLQIDTIYTQMDILNNSNVYHIGDTIKFFSKISDSILSSKGASFVHERSYFSTLLQPFKVVNNAGVYELTYANIDFNPIVNVGQFQNYPYNGYYFLFKRAQPYNTLQVSFVAGKVGLYIFDTNGESGANNVQRKNDFCTNYPNSFTFPLASQHINYWDSLGISNISLASSGGYKVASKTEKDYVFIKVIP